jgi:hypothetical protein
MISAIAFVLFVRDKYTINTLLESIGKPALALIFVSDGEHDEIKIENANRKWIIEMVLFITLYWLPLFSFLPVSGLHMPTYIAQALMFLVIICLV